MVIIRPFQGAKSPAPPAGAYFPPAKVAQVNKANVAPALKLPIPNVLSVISSGATKLGAEAIGAAKAVPGDVRHTIAGATSIEQNAQFKAQGIISNLTGEVQKGISYAEGAQLKAQYTLDHTAGGIGGTVKKDVISGADTIKNGAISAGKAVEQDVKNAEGAVITGAESAAKAAVAPLADIGLILGAGLLLFVAAKGSAERSL